MNAPDPSTRRGRPRPRADWPSDTDRLADDDQPRRPAAELAGLVPVGGRRDPRLLAQARAAQREHPRTAAGLVQPQHRRQRRRGRHDGGHRPDRPGRTRRVGQSRPTSPSTCAKHRGLRLDGRVRSTADYPSSCGSRRPAGAWPDARDDDASACRAHGAPRGGRGGRDRHRGPGRRPGPRRAGRAAPLPDRRAAAVRRVGAGPRRCTAALLVADLHADSLLWGRDLLRRSGQGQVDVPRLIEGNVALQVLAASTKSPRHLNIERNDDRSDDIILIALAGGLAARPRGGASSRGRCTWPSGRTPWRADPRAGSR